MSKKSAKSLGLRKAHDHGAQMRAMAEAAMPEIMNAGAAPSPMQAPPAAGPMPMKKGGKPRHFAMGGAVGKIRKGQATTSGAPKKPGIPKSPPSPNVRFRGKAGVGGC